MHSEHWSINPPQKHHSLFFAKSPLKSANCWSPPFLGNSPLYIGFSFVFFQSFLSFAIFVTPDHLTRLSLFIYLGLSTFPLDCSKHYCLNEVVVIHLACMSKQTKLKFHNHLDQSTYGLDFLGNLCFLFFFASLFLGDVNNITFRVPQVSQCSCLEHL